MLSGRTHHEFIGEGPTSCRTCTRLVSPTLDPAAPPTPDLGGQPERAAQLLYEAIRRQKPSIAKHYRPQPTIESWPYGRWYEPAAPTGLVRLLKP